MEVKIGVQNAAREIVLESGQSADEVAKIVNSALSSDDKAIVLSDERGRQVIVPTGKLAYIEIGEPEARRVGFGAL